MNQEPGVRSQGSGIQAWPNLVFAACILIPMLASLASARTITLTADDADEMASISPLAPRLSWVMGPQPGVFNTQPTLYWESRIALLMRFPITDHVPKGQRVTKAELTIIPNYVAGAVNIQVRRLLAEWGTGVCQQYRMTYPKKVEWNQPGGRGAGTDRTAKDTAMFKIIKVGEHAVDVTEDIELWYTGGAPNRGWIFTHERDVGIAYFASPYAPQTAGAKTWKLQLTFEPQ